LRALDDAAFRQVFAGSPIKRIGRNRMVRNAAIAAGNSGRAELVPMLEGLLADEDAVVAEAAAWAVRRLASSPSEDGEGDHPKGGGGVGRADLRGSLESR
jgi:epoxyqueuosine reductase